MKFSVILIHTSTTGSRMNPKCGAGAGAVAVVFVVIIIVVVGVIVIAVAILCCVLLSLIHIYMYQCKIFLYTVVIDDKIGRCPILTLHEEFCYVLLLFILFFFEGYLKLHFTPQFMLLMLDDSNLTLTHSWPFT